MKYEHPLKKILSQARPYWDRQEMRVGVRTVFSKALQCRTPELGAEVYASENQELILYHTCKSRACPSCGYRANVQWLRERWVALPNEIYKGSRSRRRIYFGPFSATTRSWPRLCQL